MTPRLRRRALLTLACILPAARAAADPASLAAPEPSALLAHLMQTLDRVRKAEAHFTETRTLTALDRPVVSHGQLVYRRGQILEKLTDPPHAERLVVRGEHLSLTVGGGPTRHFDLADRPRLAAVIDAIRAPLDGDLALLRRRYRVQASGTLAGWRLDLIPRTVGLARLVRRVRIEGVGDQLRSVLTVFANGDRDLLAVMPRP